MNDTITFEPEPNRGEMTVEELSHWLSENGYAEDQPGWGHVTCDELAVALHKEYIMFRAYRAEV